jgi:drug/metabolite transporter (DMT)-like permease
MTSPVNGSVFWSLTPLLMPLLGYLVLGERLEMAVLAAAAMAFAATMLLVWGQNEHGGGSWLGDLCVAGGVIASAVNALLARRTAQAGANPLVTSCWQLNVRCHVDSATDGVLFRRRARTSSTPAGRRYISLIYLGLVVSAGGVYILSNYALRHLPVGRVGLFSCLVGPVGTAMAALLLGHRAQHPRSGRPGHRGRRRAAALRAGLEPSAAALSDALGSVAWRAGRWR